MFPSFNMRGPASQKELGKEAKYTLKKMKVIGHASA
jgi:hypothetical protein